MAELTRTTARDQVLPGSKLDQTKAPGHWVLAGLGKRILRPGGRAMTEKLVAGLAVTSRDRVVEFAPGLGMTTRMVLQNDPAAYVAIERDPDAAVAVQEVLGPLGHECLCATVQDSGLPEASATVVFGEAYLTMQHDARKREIVQEAYRLLEPAGRFGLHELAILPDLLDDVTQEAIRDELRAAIRVGARPLTVADWKALLTGAGFEVVEQNLVPMNLLTPGRLVRDEGLLHAVRFVVKMLRNEHARARVLGMRKVFRNRRKHLAAIMLVATKPA